MKPARIIRALAVGVVATLSLALALTPKSTHAQPALTAGDVERGKALFDRKCTGCHSLDSNREGPRLRDVYGRKAGTVSGFSYSDALRNSGVVWDAINLERWIRDSDAMLPQSAMGFAVPKTQDRADIVAYLRTLK